MFYQNIIGLHLAALIDFHALVPNLAKHRIQIDSRDCRNITALSHAIGREYEEVLHSLLQEEANLEALDN